MVEQSILDNAPIIGASIQYRLGALGYLHTPEPGNANLALNDQRNALRWIQKFVGGFGGDRERVTAFGESAGSMSIASHLLAPKPVEGPLFNRAILMSGPPGPASAPVPVSRGEERYEAFLQKLGISGRGLEGLQKAREADVKDVVAASAQLGDEGGLWLSVQDEEFFGEEARNMSWDRIPELIGKCDWCNDIMLGCTSFEVSRPKPTQNRPSTNPPPHRALPSPPATPPSRPPLSSPLSPPSSVPNPPPSSLPPTPSPRPWTKTPSSPPSSAG